MLYSFFWVIPRRVDLMHRRFGTLCLFHLHRWCEQEESFYTANEDGTESSETSAYKTQTSGNYPPPKKRIQRRYSCQILMKCAFLDRFLKNSNIKFNDNPSSASRAVACGRTDGHTDMTKLKTAFGHFCENCLKNIIALSKINWLLRVKENVFTARYEMEFYI